MIVETLQVGLLQVGCYILKCEETGQGVVIDPGGDAPRILDRIKQMQVEIVTIPNTHAHFDHIMGVDQVRSLTGAPFWLHAAEEPVLQAAPQFIRAWLGIEPGPIPQMDGTIEVDRPIRFGQEELEVRFVPGHSPGSVAFIHHASRQVFSGDVIAAGSVGRFDLPGGHGPTLLQSIRTQLLTLPDDYSIHPGHGPSTTVGRERRSNPFLQPGAEYLFE